MGKKTFFEKDIEELQSLPIFQLEGLLLRITNQIAEIMQTEDMSYSDLARKMNVHKSYISRIMNCDENMSLKTLIKISIALDCIVKVDIDSSFKAKKLEGIRNYIPLIIDIYPEENKENVIYITA